MANRLLVITNMGPTKANPYEGQFVFRQVDAVRDKGVFERIDVFCMPAVLRMLPSLVRYPLWILWFVVSRLWRRYSHVHVHFFMPSAVLASWYRRVHPGSRLIATFHGTDVYAYMPPGRYYRALLKRFDHLFFVSERLKQRLLDALAGVSVRDLPGDAPQIKAGLPPISVLPAGIPDYFRPRQTAFSERTTDLLFVGNLLTNKGPDRLIQLLRHINTPLRVVIIGAGEWKNTLEQTDFGHHNVRIESPVTGDQLVPFYQSSRFLINLSRNESFGLVMTEAMACGAVALATRTDGSLAQIKDAETGFLFEGEEVDHNCEQIADRIEKIIALEAAQLKAIAQAAERSVKGLRLGEISTKLTKIYLPNR